MIGRNGANVSQASIERDYCNVMILWSLSSPAKKEMGDKPIVSVAGFHG
jgi:hypothetical protein